jgi:sugar transferase (PEP-CTERM system associated)
MKFQKIYTKNGFLILWLVNTLIPILSFYLAIWMRSKISSSPYVPRGSILQNAILFTLLSQYFFYLFDLYNFRIKLSTLSLYNFRVKLGTLSLILGISTSIIIALGILGAGYYFIPSLNQSKSLLALSGLFTIILISSWWLIYDKTIRVPQRILIVGSSEIGETIAREILSNPDMGYHLIGFVDEFSLQGYADQENKPDIKGNQVNTAWMAPTLGTLTELNQVIKNTTPDVIVVALAERRKFFPMETLLDYKLRGMKIYDSIDFYEQLTGKILVQGLRPGWLIFSDGFKKSKLNETSKRVLDIMTATLGLILASPLMVIVAILIKLESRGPIIFSQERVGQWDRSFTIHKFRSMIQEAEATTGPVWATDKDPRITRIGQFIRKYRIDELPQLFNILKGDMSLVGPRPERAYFVEILRKETPYYAVRSTVKPGLTGWAQVSFHYGSSVEDAVEKLQYDLFYIKNRSLFLDLVIILKTIGVVLLGKGAK